VSFFGGDGDFVFDLFSAFGSLLVSELGHDCSLRFQ
jgi:hypothetical protein